ncbi:MAG TPA: alpha/beta fold hydrolase [Gammaproteobacteria bacterium]|nr:alpha/beta fold hydrolase [Gammaproteobacteria bacterium]
MSTLNRTGIPALLVPGMRGQLILYTIVQAHIQCAVSMHLAVQGRTPRDRPPNCTLGGVQCNVQLPVRSTVRVLASLMVVFAITGGLASRAEQRVQEVKYCAVDVDGIKVFYRQAGPADGPPVLLLHGFPASSHMFRDLMPKLAGRYRVMAPDYPGYGHSDALSAAQFNYTFERLTDVGKSYGKTWSGALQLVRAGFRWTGGISSGHAASRARASVDCAKRSSARRRTV